MNTDDSKMKKDGWDKLEILAKVIAAVLIPIVVGFYTLEFRKASANAEQSKIDQEYLRLSIGILSENRKKEEKDEVLRNYAVDLMKKYTPVEMNPSVEEALRAGDLTVPKGHYYSYDYGDSYDYDYGDSYDYDYGDSYDYDYGDSYDYDYGDSSKEDSGSDKK